MCSGTDSKNSCFSIFFFYRFLAFKLKALAPAISKHQYLYNGLLIQQTVADLKGFQGFHGTPFQG